MHSFFVPVFPFFLPSVPSPTATTSLQFFLSPILYFPLYYFLFSNPISFFSRSFLPTIPLTPVPTTTTFYWLWVRGSGEKIGEDDFSVGRKDREKKRFSLYYLEGPPSGTPEDLPEPPSGTPEDLPEGVTER
jgi:hypothetical protein